MKKLEIRMPTEKELPFLLLLIVGVMEFLFITMESLFSYIGYYLVEDYIIVPCLLFVGIALTGKLSSFAKKRMWLSAIAIFWFVVVQMIHKLSGMGTHPIGTVFFVYLMAFPFAAVTDDQENKGLNMIGWTFIAAAMVQIFYATLLILDCVPSLLKQFVYWDGSRLNIFWHSNITACFLMIAIGLCAVFCFQCKGIWKKASLITAMGLLFAVMALTNCRTTLLMTSAFFGSIIFFLISKGGWKRFVVGLLAALVVLVISFNVSSDLFELHNEAMKMKIANQLEILTVQDQQLTSEDIAMIKENVTENFSIYEGEVHIFSSSGQGSLSNDMCTLNGRTGVWKSALKAVRDNRSLLLWGTEYVGVAISVYNPFEVDHAHNSWMEMLLRLGVPGLLLAMAFTCIAVRSAWFVIWSQQAEIWKKVMAVLTMCVMVAGFLEPYLFVTNVYYHITDFIFFFCTGYLDYWRHQLKKAV